MSGFAAGRHALKVIERTRARCTQSSADLDGLVTVAIDRNLDHAGEFRATVLFDARVATPDVSARGLHASGGLAARA